MAKITIKLCLLLILTLKCTAQLDLTSCTPNDYACISNRTRIDQAVLEIPNYVTYPIQDDPFYVTPDDISRTQPGDILRLEQHGNLAEYDIPPGTSLSRFMYASQDEQGNVVPATASILWPFTPKPFNGSPRYSIVAWAHGTTGVSRQCAVSNTRNLQYDFRSVFTLASLGYAVVIADYVGLGSDAFFNYLAYKLHATDVVNAVVAAQSGFPLLSDEWVSFGHSEGGGVAWAIAERQAEQPIPGFLGTIAAAPPPYQLDNTAEVSNTVFTAFLSFTIARLYGLDITAIFNPVPLQALELVQSIGGCNDAGYAAFATFTAEDIYANTSWPKSQPAVDFVTDYSVGGKPLGGPMLILQGSADSVVAPAGAEAALPLTCDATSADTSVEYVSIIGQDHNPSLYASQRLWVQWIEDRFNSVPLVGGCRRSELRSAFELEDVQLAERFTVQYTKPWITIFSSTFLPRRLWEGFLGYAQRPS